MLVMRKVIGMMLRTLVMLEVVAVVVLKTGLSTMSLSDHHIFLYFLSFHQSFRLAVSPELGRLPVGGGTNVFINGIENCIASAK